MKKQFANLALAGAVLGVAAVLAPMHAMAAEKLVIVTSYPPDTTITVGKAFTKATGIQAYTQWLGYQIRGKAHLYAEVILPVITHFRDKTTTRHRTMSRRNRPRRQ